MTPIQDLAGAVRAGLREVARRASRDGELGANRGRVTEAPRSTPVAALTGRLAQRLAPDTVWGAKLRGVAGLLSVGAVRAELRKIAKRPSSWILLGVELAILVLIGYLLTWAIYTHPPAGARLPRGAAAVELKKGLYPAGFVGSVLHGGLPSVLTLILGVLAVGSEFGWGTWKTLFTQGPARLQTWAAKIVALVIAVATGLAATFAAAAVLSVIVAAADGQPLGTWPSAATIMKGMLAAWFIWGWWALFGATLSIVFRNAALAVGLGLAYQLVFEGLVFGIVGNLGGGFIGNIQKFFPGPNATAVQEAFPALGAAASQSKPPPVDATQGAIVLGLYCAAAIVAAGLLLHRRDTSS